MRVERIVKEDMSKKLNDMEIHANKKGNVNL